MIKVCLTSAFLLADPGKRGITHQHNGLASVIDLVTGLPIHYEVLSNFYMKCSLAERNISDSVDWKTKHAPNCSNTLMGHQMLCR